MAEDVTFLPDPRDIKRKGFGCELSVKFPGKVIKNGVQEDYEESISISVGSNYVRLSASQALFIYKALEKEDVMTEVKTRLSKELNMLE